MLSGVYQTEKEILCDIPYLWSLREQQSSDHKEKGADLQMQRTHCQSTVGRGGGGGRCLVAEKACLKSGTCEKETEKK